MMTTQKIAACRITAMPKTMFDPMPIVQVQLAGSDDWMDLFSYYPDELSFSPLEFPGLTVAEANQLKHQKDVAFLRA